MKFIIDGAIGTSDENDDAVWNTYHTPWCLARESFDRIECVNHFHLTDDVVPFFNECYYALKPGGTLFIKAPYYTSMLAHADPGAKRMVSEASFLCTSRKWREENGVCLDCMHCDFSATCDFLIAKQWAARTQEAQDFAARHYWNVIKEIHVTLTKVS